ncbi:MAG TPA: histidinol-phosphate transaminase [Methanospirillum sp.]|nr:histidinol-phosphate transaminase [Methanospirillum sp.]
MSARLPVIQKAKHGGTSLPGLAKNKLPLLDFSVNLNPCAPCLNTHIDRTDTESYPDDEYQNLKAVIARHHGRNPDEITVGNGSVEVIRTLCHTLLTPGDVVHVPPHTFSEYALSARLAGAAITSSHKDHMALSFRCNPDNPSGVLEPADQIRKMLDICAKKNCILCVDEAFIDLADPNQSVSQINHPHLFVLRSMTKSFSMAGMRFGYGIGDPKLIAAMEVMRPPWSVNALAEKMAVEAFSRYNELESSREYIRLERERMLHYCRELNLSCSDASANYILLNTGRDAEALTQKLMTYNIRVRDCTSFGLPTSIRVAVRTKEENSRILEALKDCLH